VRWKKAPNRGLFSFGTGGKIGAGAEFEKFSEFSADKKIGNALIRRFGEPVVGKQGRNPAQTAPGPPQKNVILFRKNGESQC
jgi:hypothetical protein